MTLHTFSLVVSYFNFLSYETLHNAIKLIWRNNVWYLPGSRVKALEPEVKFISAAPDQSTT